MLVVGCFSTPELEKSNNSVLSESVQLLLNILNILWTMFIFVDFIAIIYKVTIFLMIQLLYLGML